MDEAPRARNMALVHRVSLRALATLGTLLVGACNTTYLEQSKDEPQNAADIMRAADLRPRSPQPTATVDTGGASAPKAFSFFGSPTPPPDTPQPSGSQDVEASAGGYTLNFENAPISQVAKSILGDILGVGYVIDPRAQGTISLSSGRPVEKKDMLYVLESALSANNLVMVRNASGYRVGPANEGGVGAVDEGKESAEPGFGLTVIPLQYVSGTTLSKLLEGFATRPGAIRTDPSGKLLIVVGTGSERQSAVETVRSFDVDWLRGQSVGMYPVQNSTPEPIVGELEKIMDSGDSGLGHGLVKFQPVSRLNSILVVASKPELLRKAVSASYYALFHCVCLEDSTYLLPHGTRQQQLRLARAFGHRELKGACAWVAGRQGNIHPHVKPLVEFLKPTAIADVASSFCDLQEARHDADYDHLAPFSKPSALANVDDTEKAMSALEDAEPGQREAFFSLLAICARLPHN